MDGFRSFLGSAKALSKPCRQSLVFHGLHKFRCDARVEAKRGAHFRSSFWPSQICTAARVTWAHPTFGWVTNECLRVVDVVAPVIVAAHVNGNDPRSLDRRRNRAGNLGGSRPIRVACCTSRSWTYIAARSNCLSASWRCLPRSWIHDRHRCRSRPRGRSRSRARPRPRGRPQSRERPRSDDAIRPPFSVATHPKPVRAVTCLNI